ncbi:hypothetical protein Q31b_24630 [Novipirellula aureliae]|uniref:Uncharacterized protein n=2 Tax=Novipirellula aureliae TaxID=2527966 RepID=A0A5C6E198_9BACT|nr:hypothetical protein Q31b_24630 [Novipirellula aureliae]
MGMLDDFYALCRRGETVDSYKKTKWTLEQSQKLLKKARDYGLAMNPEAEKVFRDQTKGLDAKLTKITNSISKGEKIYMAYRDADKIYRALRVLNAKENNVMRYDPESAVTAFGVLFHGLGGFVKHFPAPANAYGTVLQAVGTKLVGVYKMMDPTLRKGWGGPQLKQLEEEGLKIGV